MGYKRVIPRDFFNEAKLLKCLGRLELIINHTGPNNIAMQSEHDGEPFDIQQNPHDGSLYVSNYHVFIGNTEEVRLFVPYNNKEDSYPLMGEFNGETYQVFNAKGEIITTFGTITL